MFNTYIAQGWELGGNPRAVKGEGLGVRAAKLERRARRRRQHYCQGWKPRERCHDVEKTRAELGYSKKRISCEHAQGNGSGFSAHLPLTAVKTTCGSGPSTTKKGSSTCSSYLRSKRKTSWKKEKERSLNVDYHVIWTSCSRA